MPVSAARHPVTIRPAGPADAELIHAGLVGIAETVGERHRVTSTADDIRRFGFGERPAFETLIAEVDGAFAGLCLFFASFSTWQGRPGVYVQDLYVVPDMRGHAVGALLMQHLAALTRRRGGRYIRLAVDTGNAGAQGFYERLGLRHSASEQVHAAYHRNFDALADAGERQPQGELP